MTMALIADASEVAVSVDDRPMNRLDILPARAHRCMRLL